MKYYKDILTMEVFAYELDGSQDHLIGDKVLMTPAEVAVHTAVKITVPQVVTPRQARKALRQLGLIDTINTTIAASGNPDLIDDWEYALEIRRDWVELITISNTLGLTSAQLDDLFILAGTL